MKVSYRVHRPVTTDRTRIIATRSTDHVTTDAGGSDWRPVERVHVDAIHERIITGYRDETRVIEHTDTRANHQPRTANALPIGQPTGTRSHGRLVKIAACVLNVEHAVSRPTTRTWQNRTIVLHTDAIGQMHYEVTGYVCSWPRVCDLWPVEGWTPDRESSNIVEPVFTPAPVKRRTNPNRWGSLKPFK